MTPKISIIIVHWNVRELLRQNLAPAFSLREEIPFEVFVVDNASEDGSTQMVRQEFPWVQLLINDWNAGFAVAMNQALRHARGEALLALNPDMLVGEQTLARAWEALMMHPNIGAVGVKLRAQDGSLVPSVRRDPSFADQLAILLKLPHLGMAKRATDRYHATDMDYGLTQVVEQVRGSFLAVRRDVFRVVGPWDERFFIWFEDVDYCRRVREAGYQVQYVADVSCQDAVGEALPKCPRHANNACSTKHGAILWQVALRVAGHDRVDVLAVDDRRRCHDRSFSLSTNMTLALQLVAYNGSMFLERLFSLERQTDRDWSLLVVDQSQDADERAKTAEILDHYRDRLPMRILTTTENRGFAGGHQWIFEQNNAEAVLLLNQDAALDPEYIARVRQALEQRPDVAAVSGAIFQLQTCAHLGIHDTVVVDSLGLVKRDDESVVDDRQGQWIRVQDLPIESMDVFGISGCLALYRRAAVVTSCSNGQLFDPAYFMYKEDVDLAYRLKRAGWNALVVPAARAWHARTFKARRMRPRGLARMEYFSYRNHWWNL